MKTGLELISLERWEQMFKHGRTIEQDVSNNDECQLSIAACTLAHTHASNAGYLFNVPYGWDEELFEKMRMKPYKERLIIAGALIAAEIDRLQNK